MANETYSFELAADVKAARKAVEGFASETQKQLDSISFKSTISSVRDGFEIAKGAFERVSGFFEHASEEAAKTEENVRLLNNTMRVSGEYTKAASDQMVNFADSLAKVSTYSDDAILSSLALAKNFGLSNQEAKKLATTAADLAAFTGKDLNTATQELAATYNGFINRDLGRMIPALKNLTKAQLESGAAIDFLNNKLRGSAADALNSFSGQQKQREKEIEDFQKFFGRHINIMISDWIRYGKSIGNALNSLGDLNRANQEAEKSFNTSIFDRATGAIQKFALANKEAADTQKAIAARQKEAADLAAKEELEAFKKGFVEKRKELKLKSLSDELKLDEKYQEDLVTLGRAYGLRLIKSSKEFLDLRKGLEDEHLKDVAKLQEKRRAEFEAAENKFDEARKKQLETSVKEPIRQLIIFGAELDRNSALGVGASLLASVTKGAAGASKLISSQLGDALSRALTGTDALTGPFSEIIDLLGQGPAKVKETVSQFIEAIPTIIQNIAESLPVIIETIAEKLPAALAKTMPTVAAGFTIELVKHIPDIIKGFVDGLIEGAKAFVDTIINLVTGGLSDIGGSITGKGSGSVFEGIPVLGGIGDLLGIAGGGTIPDSPGLKGDKFGPVRLDAGETVLDHSLTKQLRNALDGGGLGNSGMMTVVIQVGQSELARAILDLNRGGFRTA